MSTELLIQCCAPTLAGMKTGSIYSCPYETREELLVLVLNLDTRFKF